jgi:hypothetical protein
VGIFQEEKIFATMCSILSGGSCQLDIAKNHLEPVKSGERIIGRISDERAKYLYMFGEAANEFSANLAFEHDERHSRNIETPEACKAAQRREMDILDAQIISWTIFWEFALKEFPHLRCTDEVALRKGWMIVLKGNHKLANKPLYASDEFANHFLDRLILTCQGNERTDDLQSGVQDVEVLKGEQVIGILTDKLLQGMYLLYKKMIWENLVFLRETQKYLRRSRVDPKVADDLFERSIKNAQFKKRTEILQTFFWLGVKELHPDFKSFDSFGLRNGWKMITDPGVNAGVQGDDEEVFSSLNPELN